MSLSVRWYQKAQKQERGVNLQTRRNYIEKRKYHVLQ